MQRKLLTIITIFVFLSCGTSNPETEESNVSNMDSVKLGTDLVAVRTFVKQPIQSIDNTVWIHNPFPDCTDTLKFTTQKAKFFRCEHDLDDDITFNINADTLYVDRHGLISEVGNDYSTEIKSKYKLILSDNKLVVVGISHRYDSIFKLVDAEFLFQEFAKL